MSAPLQQFVRAAVMAGVSTYLALGLHVLGGGAAPQTAGVALAGLASLAAATQLARKPLTRWRVAVAAALSQVFFHGMFVVTAGAAPSATADAAMARAMAHMGHSHAAVGDHASTMTHGGGSMLAAHGIAAVATYLMLRHAELWWFWLSTAAAVVREALTPRPAVFHTPFTPARERITLAHATTPRFAIAVPLGLRAPPLPYASL